MRRPDDLADYSVIEFAITFAELLLSPSPLITVSTFNCFEYSISVFFLLVRECSIVHTACWTLNFIVRINQFLTVF